MGMQVEYHLTGSDSLQGKPKVESGVVTKDKVRFAWMRITRGTDTMTVYVNSLEMIGTLATELTTLEMAAREAWQGNQEGTAV